MDITNTKLTIAGHIIEYDVMETPIAYGPGKQTSGTRSSTPISSEKDRETSSVNRAKAAVRRLVNANAHKWIKPDGKPFLPIFVTFTFEKDIRDFDVASSHFKTAIQRLNYFISGTKKHVLHYIAVTEFQDKNRDGVIHYHVLFFNLPFIKQIYDEMNRIWGHGNVNVKSVRRVKNLGRYMVKYMSKNLKDGRLKGRKKYFASKGLKRWDVLYDQSLVGFVIDMLPENAKVHTSSWDSPHCKRITRVTYNIQGNPKALDWLYDLVLQ